MFDSCTYQVRFPLASAVDDDVVRVALEREMLPLPQHPQIKRVMQKQVGQQGTDDTALPRATLTFQQVSLCVLCWRIQPAFDIEDEPLVFHVLPDCSHNQIVVEDVKGTYDTLPIISTFPKRSALSD